MKHIFIDMKTTKQTLFALAICFSGLAYMANDLGTQAKEMNNNIKIEQEQKLAKQAQEIQIFQAMLPLMDYDDPDRKYISNKICTYWKEQKLLHPTAVSIDSRDCK